jgi:hypothetical protein
MVLRDAIRVFFNQDNTSFECPVEIPQGPGVFAYFDVVRLVVAEVFCG